MVETGEKTALDGNLQLSVQSKKSLKMAVKQLGWMDYCTVPNRECSPLTVHIPNPPLLGVSFTLPVMGNTQSGYTLTRTAATLDSFISELGPDIVYEKRYVLYLLTQDRHDNPFRSLGSSRFLKTVRCRHQNGLVVVKIYIKPDLGLSLSRYQRRLKGMSRVPLYQC